MKTWFKEILLENDRESYFVRKSFLCLALFLLCSVTFAQYGNGRYTFVFLNTNPDRADLPQAQVDSLQAGHMANINRLVKEQKMIAAGPFYTGGGIFIFDTDLEATQAVLDSDPAIAAGRFILEVFPADVITNNKGNRELCTLWHLNEADVEMTSYYFVHYKTDATNEDVVAAKTNRFTEDLISKVKKNRPPDFIVGALNFNDNQGQVIIYKSDKEGGLESEFAQHDLVKKGLMTFEHKRIYFPKGVFCEK